MIALFISMLGLGLVTSLHCVSMCGPLVVTYAVKGEENGPWYRKLVPNAAYQGAKILSYVLVGFVLGAVGSALHLEALRPYVMLFAGAFMIVIGLGMTGLAPWAARLTPRPPKFLMTAIMRLRKKASADALEGDSSLGTPIMFGLMTGLMPCAPLMAAQLSAAATGSAVTGAIAMFAFGLGTMPLMLAFGTASSMLPKNLKQRMMVALAVVVMLFGVVYINRAAMRLGWPVNAQTAKVALFGGPAVASANPSEYRTGADGVVEVPLTIANTQFQPSTVQIPANAPVRLVVDRKEANACSDQISLPQLGVLKDLAPNAITQVDVPATQAGTYTLTCGMGMMSGRLVVGDAPAGRTPPSPLAWAFLGLSLAGGTMWVTRRRRELAGATCRAERPGRVAQQADDAPQRILGFTPAELVLVALALGAAVLIGLSVGGGVTP